MRCLLHKKVGSALVPFSEKGIIFIIDPHKLPHIDDYGMSYNPVWFSILKKVEKISLYGRQK
jgi:hypothetical protein